MKDTFGGWKKVDSMDIDAVADLIVTNRSAKEAKADEWIFSKIGDPSLPINVLDFGCGFGRNTFAIGAYSRVWTVWGYDSDEMLGRREEYFQLHYSSPILNVHFSSEWEYIKSLTFDIIFCNLVLQHIKEKDIATYLTDFKAMTRRLLVAGRRFNDDKEKRSTWTIIAENGLIPFEFYRGHIRIPFQPEGFPEDHNWAIYNL